MLLILLLSANPKLSKKLTIASFVIGGISGLLIYGYGYITITDNVFLAILKAIYSASASFVGNNDYENISTAPFMQTDRMQIVCIFIQLCALYATASAVINSIGAEALKRFRLWLSRRNNINLIYGTNDDSLNLGKELLTKKDGIVIFIDDHQEPIANVSVSALGCVLLTDSHAINGDKKFLRKIGFKNNKRNLTLYALDKNSNNNLQYATRLLETFKNINVSPERLSLVLMGQEEIAVSKLQHTKQKYGYGFVSVVNEPQMAARLLTIKYPPCNSISFSENGKALNDFHAMIIGFGQVGQAVLKSIVMNGQFDGSSFRADVFAPDIENADGNFNTKFSSLKQQYDISFYNYDARSRNMYEYLKQNARKLNYVVITTGCEKTNHELAEELIEYFNTVDCKIPVYNCTKQGVLAYDANGTVKQIHKLYSSELLCNRNFDEKAMVLNHIYQPKTEKSPLQNWLECDYFSRQSCRAATDFIPAILRSVGKDFTNFNNDDWNLSGEQIENLSRTEHKRWCAFHYCMGFSTMDDDEFNSRAEIYCNQILKNEKNTIRIGKNMAAKTHACLISWEKLDALSQKESAITGKNIDYKQMDTDNILAIPQILNINE